VRDPARLRGRYAVAGIGLSRFGKVPGVSAMGFCLEAAKRAIDDCGVPRDAVDGVLCLMPAQMGEQHGWASRVAAFLGITPSFCATMDMGGATAIGMLQTAVALLEAGMCTTVLATFGCQNSPQGVIPQLFGSPWAIPYGDVGAITFMGHVARRQMYEHGIRSVDYGNIAVQWRKHAMTNPHAQMRKPITLEDHQSSRLITEPLRLLDCAPFTDGGGAFVVTSVERAKDLKAAPLISGAASTLVGDDPAPGRGVGRRRGARLSHGGLRPRGHRRRAALRRVHPAGRPRPGELPLRFLGRGSVGRSAGWRRDGSPATRRAALSEGHLSGFGHLTEAVWQVRGTSGSQVRDVTLSFVSGTAARRTNPTHGRLHGRDPGRP
jgi:acetyl-CoA acetyltransferase